MTTQLLNRNGSLYNLLYFFTAFTIFINPLLEAPKNIGMGLVLLTAIAYEIQRKSYKTISRWDVFFLLFLLSYVVGVPLASEPTKFGAISDVFRYILFGWVIYRAQFDETKRFGLAFWATLGTVIGVLYGAWDFYIAGNGQYWTINSVGHVNHAAIYDAIVTCMAFSTLLGYWNKFSFQNRVTWLLMFLVCLGYIILGESRATFGAVFIVFLVIGLFFARKSKKLLFITLAAIALAILLALSSNVRVVSKQEINEQQNNVLSNRSTIWNAGFEAFKEHPLFGLGKENFRNINITGPGFIDDTNHASHAHNIYVNNLVEGGVWGFSWQMALFLAIAWSLLRKIPGKSSSEDHWVSWGYAVSGLGITLIVGMVNTPFHHEHGNLTMLCFALWLTFSRTVAKKNKRLFD